MFTLLLYRSTGGGCVLSCCSGYYIVLFLSHTCLLYCYIGFLVGADCVPFCCTGYYIVLFLSHTCLLFCYIGFLVGADCVPSCCIGYYIVLFLSHTCLLFCYIGLLVGAGCVLYPLGWESIRSVCGFNADKFQIGEFYLENVYLIHFHGFT